MIRTSHLYSFFRGTVILSLITLFLVFFPCIPAEAVEIEKPQTFFGFTPGADRMLFEYDQLIAYLEKLDKASPRLKMVEIGTSPLGKKMYIAFISTEANIRNLDRLKEINRRLALDPAIPEFEREKLIGEGRVFVTATLSMHSGEVGPSQAAPLTAYSLVTAEDPDTLAWLDNVVFAIVPCHNPDGMDMVVKHYKKYKGTKYEGSSMPGVYHKYVGHDNNRDFVHLTQSDTLAVSEIFSKTWFPQVMVEKHQMGNTGVRYFVPPNHDPVAENVDGNLWSWCGVLGTGMAREMNTAGLKGVAQGYIFDNYWPGSTETCVWKNVIGLLTEAASVKYASPVYIEPNELRVGGKGLSDYKKSVKFLHPWPGGWWRLGDIVKYEFVSTYGLLKTAARNSKEILEFRNDMCRREVHRGQTEPPFYYVMPTEQHDRGEWAYVVNLLKKHGIRVFRLTEPAMLGGHSFAAGAVVVPMGQPFRPFIKEVMEAQEYPVRHYTPDGKVIRPYDIASWSLPLHRGVKSVEINCLKKTDENFESLLEEIKEPFQLKENIPANYKAAIFTVANNESFKAAFLAVKKGLTVERLEKSFKVGEKSFPKGSFLVRHTGNGDAIKKLVAQLDVSPVFLETDVNVKTVSFKIPRVALVETFFHDKDAGWTRYLFDFYHLPYRILHPGDFAATDLTKQFDVVVFPDSNKSILMEGKRKRGDRYRPTGFPPEYSKGIGKKGMARLTAFIENGGVVVAWGNSTGLFMDNLEVQLKGKEKEEYRLPVSDMTSQLKDRGMYCPGSLMRVLLKRDHPLTLGLEKEIGVMFRGRPVFRTSVPQLDMDRRVIARFPEKDILLSGYAEAEEKLGNQAIMVWLKKNKGQLVLMGFQPQFRVSTGSSYKLLFNSILLPAIH